MNAQPAYLPTLFRAAIVRAYRYRFDASEVSSRPRSLTFETAQRMRARWLAGEDARTLADKFCSGKFERALRILFGYAWTTPARADVPAFRPLVDGLYAALDACTFAPLESGASDGNLPLIQFARGDLLPAADIDHEGEGAETVPAGSPEAEPSDQNSPAWEAWRKTPFPWPEPCPLCGGAVEFGPWSSDETDRVKGLECLNRSCQLHGDTDGGITVERWNRKVAKLAKTAAADLLE